MKARIKKTGEIVKIAEYAKITLDMRDSYGNPIELKPEDVELIHDVKEDNFSNTDWNQVRIQAAIAAMQARILRGAFPFNEELLAKDAVKRANNLVEELKKVQE